MNGYNFTERVRKVLALAREEAFTQRSEWLDTEHILVGLIRDGAGVGYALLENLAGDVDALYKRLHARSPNRDRPTGSMPDLPYTLGAKRVLELAMAEARDHNHSYVGTEHLLLGLVRQEKGAAALALRDSGVVLAPAREEMLRMLGTPGERTATRGSVPSGDEDDDRPRCPDCDAEMEPGYLLDRAGPRNAPTRWVAGEPSDKPSLKEVDVVAYRCPSCGLLRLYT